jgi:hypothetical protein
MLSEDEQTNLPENSNPSADESSGPERVINFPFTGCNEDVEEDSDLIYESLIAQKIQSEISSSMYKVDVEQYGSSSSIPS